MIYIVIVALIFIADQASKNYINKKYEIGEDKAVHKDIVFFTNIKNKGAFYGFMKDNRLVLMLLTMISLVTVVIAFFKNIFAKVPYFSKLGLTMLLGGALGNVYDRVVKKEVTDFIYIKRKKAKRRTVFNIADVFVFLGVIITLLHSLGFLNSHKPR